MAIHFISDLHLDDRKPGIHKLLTGYLHHQARDAEMLYLLGDIFEYWLGDDVSIPQYQDICEELAELSSLGIRLCFMRGNRDFLVGEEFGRKTGATLLPDPQIITLNGQQTLISHGDLLCTDDIEHQKFRELVNQPEVQQRLLSLPAEQREEMARQLRSMSRSNQENSSDGGKGMEIMDVNQQTVESEMRNAGVQLLIHGHTHRCAMHDFSLDGEQARRVVLADWHENHGSVLISDEKGLRFEDLTH